MSETNPRPTTIAEAQARVAEARKQLAVAGAYLLELVAPTDEETDAAEILVEVAGENPGWVVDGENPSRDADIAEEVRGIQGGGGSQWVCV